MICILCHEYSYASCSRRKFETIFEIIKQEYANGDISKESFRDCLFKKDVFFKNHKFLDSKKSALNRHNTGKTYKQVVDEIKKDQIKQFQGMFN